ncbi:MAG: hypothetical protein Q7J32_02620 [Sphingomonadaceae bacterium]|nr:hypothetical protein [Sphingomonadaceae bacterium]
MPGSKRVVPPGARQHLTTDNIGRQLRAAFDPVPTGRDDFADLLNRLEAAESAPGEPVAAE